MSKEEILEYFYTNSANLNITTILITLLAGLLIGIVIFATYYVTYKGVAHSIKFNLSLIIVLLISIVIMLMISSNIVISLGMVGALSIIRFRTAIKDSRDTVFIFWAITEGLSVGSRNFKLSFITTLFIAAILIVTSMLPKFREKYLLVVSSTGEMNANELERFIGDNTKYYKLKSSTNTPERREYIYEVVLGKGTNPRVFDEAAEIAGVNTVNLVTQSGDNLG